MDIYGRRANDDGNLCCISIYVGMYVNRDGDMKWRQGCPIYFCTRAKQRGRASFVTDEGKSCKVASFGIVIR